MKSSTNNDWISIEGSVQAGYGVASGRATNSPYPAGTIAMQQPCFLQRGLDLSAYYPGTLNVSIAPWTWELRQPLYTFQQVHWTEHHPPEDFSFVPCRLRFRTIDYHGLVYYPHPATKQAHHQRADILELLLPPIADITYTSPVELVLPTAAVVLHRPV